MKRRLRIFLFLLELRLGDFADRMAARIEARRARMAVRK
jgi:hypothetical protein